MIAPITSFSLLLHSPSSLPFLLRVPALATGQQVGREERVPLLPSVCVRRGIFFV